MTLHSEEAIQERCVVKGGQNLVVGLWGQPLPKWELTTKAEFQTFLH